MIIFCRFEHSSLPTSITKQKNETKCGTLIISCNSNISHSLTCPKIYRVHVNLDLQHFGIKKAKTIVSIAKVPEKPIHVLKLAVYPKYIQFRFKGKTFIIISFHYLKFSRRKKILSFTLDEIFSRTNLTVFGVISILGAYLISKFEVMALIGGWCLKEGGAYFKERGTLHIKFQNFVVFSFQITINNCHYRVATQK